MKKKIAIIEASGAAGEVLVQAEKVLKAVGEQYDHYFETTTLTLQKTAPYFSAVPGPAGDAALFGSTVAREAIEKEYALIATVQPVTIYPSLQHLSPLKPKHSHGLNLLGYRPLSEDAGHQSRIAQSALQQAANRKKKITIITEPGDEQKNSWLSVLEKSGASRGKIHIEQLSPEETCDRMLREPAGFDIIITSAAIGDYLFNLAASISAARLMIPSVLVAENLPFFGPAFAFGQTAESAKSSSNPVGTILSVAMMLDYFGLHEEAQIIRTAVSWTLLHGFVCKDIDPVNNYSTHTIGDLISDFVRGTIPGFAKGENMALQKSTII